MLRSHSSRLHALADLIRQQGWWMATAESCTGGLVAAALTALPGASAWFDHAVVSYSYDAKERFLRVKAETLVNEGAVSAACVEAMVEGLLQYSKADVGLAISGIAGPDGGTFDKPVGTVWFAFAKKGLTPKSVCQHFSGDRDSIRRQACDFAVDYCYAYLQSFVTNHYP